MTCPNLAFKHEITSYYSPDIWLSNASIVPNVPVSIFVNLRNQTATPGLAQVQVYWCQFATGIVGTPTLINAVVGTGPTNYNPTLPVLIPAESSYPFQIDWVPGPEVNGSISNPTQIGIFAQAIATPNLAPDGSTICAGIDHTGDFAPNKFFNALHVFGFVESGATASNVVGQMMVRQALSHSGADAHSYVAFGIANGDSSSLASRVVPRVVSPDNVPREEEPLVQSLLKTRLIEGLIAKGGRWKTPGEVSVALGLEAILHRPDRTKKMPQLGYSGAIGGALAAHLKASEYKAAIDLQQLGGELRQGILRVSPPSTVEPGDFYVVDVRQIRKGPPEETVGGCVVVVQAAVRA
jgi:hypothetical protein